MPVSMAPSEPESAQDDSQEETFLDEDEATQDNLEAAFGAASFAGA